MGGESVRRVWVETRPCSSSFLPLGGCEQLEARGHPSTSTTRLMGGLFSPPLYLLGWSLMTPTWKWPGKKLTGPTSVTQPTCTQPEGQVPSIPRALLRKAMTRKAILPHLQVKT